MGWQPIETAPKDGTAIMGFFPNAPRKTRITATWANIHRLDGLTWASQGDRYPDRWSMRPTHWMPLPEPPQ